jgi:hypothetical protein
MIILGAGLLVSLSPSYLMIPVYIYAYVDLTYLSIYLFFLFFFSLSPPHILESGHTDRKKINRGKQRLRTNNPRPSETKTPFDFWEGRGTVSCRMMDDMLCIVGYWMEFTYNSIV